MRIKSIEDLEQVLMLVQKYNVSTITVDGIEIQRDVFDFEPFDPDDGEGMTPPASLSVLKT